MKFAAVTSSSDTERRVAITPDAAKKYIQLGAQVAVEGGAGLHSGFLDETYIQAGATVGNASEVLSNADILLTVEPPTPSICSQLRDGALVAGILSPSEFQAHLSHYSAHKLNTFALELLPRISRAQAMDVLSSQSNLAGYRAVIEAVNTLGKVVPMMMTAAGTVVPAKALVLGAGVAGLQAIATAKRLGAVVSAFDVRTAAKEQVESLGAKFIEVKSDETGDAAGGYAKEMSEEYKQRQRELLHETIIKQDLVISTALIPGKPAPVLITEDMVKAMKPGAVIVDLAAIAGGNCPLTEKDKVVVKHGVTLIGHTNLPSHVAHDASALLARNFYNFVSTLLINKEKQLAPAWDDELIKGTLLTKEGVLVHPNFVT